MRPLIAILALVALSPVAAAAELPASVQRLLDADEAARDKVNATWRADFDQTAAATLAVLQAELSAAMKAEDLELAVAIKERVKQVEEERSAAALPSDPEVIAALTGHVWTATLKGKEFAFSFKGDRTCAIADSDITGTWRDLPEERVVKVKWSTAKTEDVIDYDAEELQWFYQQPSRQRVAFRPQEGTERREEGDVEEREKTREEERREKWEERKKAWDEATPEEKEEMIRKALERRGGGRGGGRRH